MVCCHPTGISKVTVPSDVVVEKFDTPAIVSCKLDTGCHVAPSQKAHVTPLVPKLPNVPVRTTTRLNCSLYPTYKYASHCGFGVRVTVGVTVGVSEFVGVIDTVGDIVSVTVTVSEFVGVNDGVGVTDSIGVIDGVGVIVFVFERVGVIVGVSDRVAVIDGVSDGVGVNEFVAVNDGVAVTD